MSINMIDKFNRKINYLRISITDRCNLRCTYCMPEEGICNKSKNEILSYESMYQVVKAVLEIGITKIRLTGGEPLIRPGIIDFINKLSSLPLLKELTMTTNGVLLKKMALQLKIAGLDRLNISLDTLNSEKYRKMTRGGDITNVFEGIDAANDAGFKKTKLNTVVIPSFNENEIAEIKKFCENKGIQLQRINYYSLSDIKSINKNIEAERPQKCGNCNRIRLTADGKFKPCLFSDIEIPVDLENIKNSVLKTINMKPKNGVKNVSRENWQIGG